MNKIINTFGYGISLTDLTKGDICKLKEELTMTPIEMTPQTGGSKNDENSRKFPIWRESKTRFYVPRFFGITKWGGVSGGGDGIVKLPLGDVINLHFKGSLREIQVPIVKKTIDHFKTNSVSGGGGALLELYCALGKTVCALNIISQIGRKTLIIVHKEFLMNQWIERASEFLPNARIGKIQGPIFDIEDKDIVIGMVQTMYDKDYDAGAFDSFGLTIFDEVHRFGSSQFSKIFFRVSTNLMLGITATMNRKDGTTPLLRHFIGPVIYTINDRGKEDVIVLGVEYTDAKCGGMDAKYLEMEYDYKGNSKYSTMIAKVCSHTPRTCAIYTIINNLLGKYPTAQIMVLSHNLSLLNSLETIIQEGIVGVKEMAHTYGFYVGGMKKKALNETENKQIVLATFAMAQEALDIKTLSILILASSKTDIVQSVGRILRDKNQNPKIVVDIIDPNTMFNNQWKKRLTYYRKCDYSIYKADWNNYLLSPFGFDTCGTTNWKQLDKKRNKTKGKMCTASTIVNDESVGDDSDTDDVGDDCDGDDVEDGDDGDDAEDGKKVIFQRKCLIHLDDLF